MPLPLIVIGILVATTAGILFWLSTTAGLIFVAAVTAYALKLAVSFRNEPSRRYECPACANKTLKLESSMQAYPAPTPIMHFNCEACSAWFLKTGSGGAYEQLDGDAVSAFKEFQETRRKALGS